MGTKSCPRIRTQFGFMDKGRLKEVVYSNMYRVLSFLWLLTWRYLLPGFGSLFKLLFRFQVGKTSVHGHKLEGEDSIGRERETVSSASGSKYEFSSGRRISGLLEEPKTLSFTVHEVSDGFRDQKCASSPLVDREGNKKQEFQGLEAEKGEAEETSVVGEVLLQAEKSDDSIYEDVIEKGVSGNEFIERNELGSEACDTEETEDSVSRLVMEEEVKEEQIPKTNKIEVNFCKEEIRHGNELSEHEISPGELEASEREISPGAEFNAEHPVSTQARDSPDGSVIEESETFDHSESSVKEQEIGLGTAHEFFCDHEGKQEPAGPIDEPGRASEGSADLFASGTSSEGLQPESPMFTDEDDRDTEPPFMRSDEFTDTDEEDFIELKPLRRYSYSSDEEVWSEDEPESEPRENVIQEKDLRPDYGVQFQHDCSDSVSDSDSEYVYEHEDIIEQLKMELKHARTGGLPTIQEESETEESSRTPPPIMQELRPLKIEERKLEYKDHLEEIQKVYRSYSDKMRKLDVLNCQTMHALGLYQMKDPFPSPTCRKYWGPAIKSILFHNLFSCKQVANVVDPSKKAIADMHMDFETAYVGQLCLSWEILHWQYRKARDLQAHESPGSIHYYHQVAGEFQHFQVLIQRFIEDEPFQGPRVEQYVKSRCVLRNLLQVPVIRDDNPKDKGIRGDEITMEVLIQVMEESMRVFWEFLRSDHNPGGFIPHHQAPITLPDNSDWQLLMDLKSDLQKKEKRVKDIARSGNCLVKKFQKQQDGGGGRGTKHVAMLVAQVELRLVWRVLNMPKTSAHQLAWCSHKLDNIHLSPHRNVFVEPSFLLFPC